MLAAARIVLGWIGVAFTVLLILGIIADHRGQLELRTDDRRALGERVDPAEPAEQEEHDHRARRGVRVSASMNPRPRTGTIAPATISATATSTQNAL